MKIAIIGASGFLGKKLFDYFSKKYEVIGVDRNPISDLITKIDAINKKAMAKFLLEQKPEVVINTVALTSSVACERDSELCKKLNYETAKNIKESCKKIGAKMIFISSSFIFDGERGNYSEEDELNPTNQYAKTKIMAEKIISELEDYLIIRVDMMYGVDNKKIKFGTGTFERETIGVGYPNQTKQPVFIDDVPRVIDFLIQKNQKGIFHVAGPDKINILDFLRKLAKLENAGDKIKIVDSSKWLVKSPLNSTLNISKIVSLGIKTTSFEDALNKIKKQIS